MSSYIERDVPSARVGSVKLLFFILLILLIVHIGFWGTLGAVLGAVLMMIILIGLGFAVVAIGAIMLVAGSLR